MITQFVDRRRLLFSNLLVLSAIVMLAFTFVATQGTQCAHAAAGSCSVGDTETFSSAIVVNDDGDDADTRIEGDTNANLLYLDAGNDAVLVGASSPSGSEGLGVFLDAYFDNPIGVGSAAVGNRFFRLQPTFTSDGSSTVADIFTVQGTLTGANGDTTRILGANINPTLVTQSNSETIGLVASMWIDEPAITKGTDTITTAATFAISGAPTEGDDNFAIHVASGSSYFGGTVYVGETNNANMSQGITINQGANDDEALAFKSSDVAHGRTTIAETDTYGLLKKDSGGSGGFSITGVSEGSTGTRIIGSGETADTTDTSSSVAAVMIRGQVQGAAHNSTGNVFAVQNHTTTRFLIKGNGDIHATNTSLTALDHHDDIALIRDLRLCLAQGTDQALIDRYGGSAPIDYTCNDLEALDLLAKDPPATKELVERVKRDANGDIVKVERVIHDAILGVDVTVSETVTELVEVDIDPVPLFSLTNTSMLVMDALRTYAEANDARVDDLEARIAALEVG